MQILLLVLVGPKMGMRLVRTTSPKIQVFRGLVLVAAGLIFVKALSLMPMAEVVSITFMAPVFIAVLSGPILHEKVGARTWVALAAGFAGVLIIIRPGSGVFGWAALLPLACAGCMTAYAMLTRRIAGKDHALTSLFYPTLAGAIVVPIFFPLAMVFPREPFHMALFVALGAMGAIGHWFLIKAHEDAPASTLSPFLYVQLLTVLSLGWLVFGELPDGIAVIGMLTVAARGLLLVLRRGKPSAP